MDSFVAADCGIRQLHARYIDAVWRKDAAGFADCFTDDGEWKIAGMHIRGRAELTEKFELLLSTSARVQIIAGTPILEAGDGGAYGRLQITELVQLTDGSSAMTLGVYHDHYVVTDGMWRFRWRHFSLGYRGPIDLSAELVPSPARPGPDEPTLTRRKAD